MNEPIKIVGASGGLVIGDTITIVYRPPWWKRLAWRLRLMRRPAQPNLRQFRVVAMMTGQCEIEPPT